MHWQVEKNYFLFRVEADYANVLVHFVRNVGSTAHPCRSLCVSIKFSMFYQHWRLCTWTGWSCHSSVNVEYKIMRLFMSQTHASFQRNLNTTQRCITSTAEHVFILSGRQFMLRGNKNTARLWKGSNCND